MDSSLPLADEFWLSAHDRPDGYSVLKDRPLGIGLGTALIAELLWYDHVRLSDGQLYLTSAPWPRDDALFELLCLIYEEEQHLPRHSPQGQKLADWITFLSGEGPDRARALLEGTIANGRYTPARQVGNEYAGTRLIERGRLTRTNSPLAVAEQRRSLFSRSTWTHIPANLNDAGWPSARITTILQRGQSLDTHHLTLAGLYIVTGLDREALGGLSSDERAFLQEQLTQLHPVLAELIDHAGSVMSRQVMTG
jgi:hypothetical protein